MANFNLTPNPTNDPSYLGYSRGTDNAQLQPLDRVPELSTKYVQPDYRANNSYGRLFEGLSEIGGNAVKMTDNIIKQNINEDLNKGINAIRDSFGVAQAADPQTSVAQAAGQAGTENNTRLMPDKPDQPAQLQRLGTKIDGLWEAYQNGTLSNSSYYAKMERFVRETKARFPGYNDEVDDMVRGKLGVTPANALRASLQDDVAKLAAKVQSQNDKWTTFERQNSDTISLIYGGYENYQKLRASGQLPTSEVEAKVANFNAIKTGNTAELQQIAVLDAKDSRRTTLGLRAANEGVTKVFDDTINSMFTSVGFDPRKYLDQIANGEKKPPSPDEKAAMTVKMGQLRANMGLAVDKYLDQTLLDASGHPSTVRAIIGNANANAVKTEVMSRLDLYDKAIMGDGDHSIMAVDATWAKARQDMTARRVLEKMPELGVTKAIRDNVGDDLIKTLWEGSPNFHDPVLQALQTLSWANIANGGTSFKKTLSDYRAAGVDNAELNWSTMKSAETYIQNPSRLKDPTVATKAVEFLFNSDNAGITQQVARKSGPQGELAFWTQMTNPTTLKHVEKMDAAHKTMVTQWAEGEFPYLFTARVNEAAQVAEQFREGSTQFQQPLSLEYDKNSNQFYFQRTSAKVGNGGAGYPVDPGLLNNAQARLNGLNSAIAGMKNVWKMNGETDITGKLYSFLSGTVGPDNPIYQKLKVLVREQEGDRVKAANK